MASQVLKINVPKDYVLEFPDSKVQIQICFNLIPIPSMMMMVKLNLRIRKKGLLFIFFSLRFQLWRPHPPGLQSTIIMLLSGITGCHPQLHLCHLHPHHHRLPRPRPRPRTRFLPGLSIRSPEPAAPTQTPPAALQLVAVSCQKLGYL